jgi:hypothetical protein
MIHLRDGPGCCTYNYYTYVCVSESNDLLRLLHFSVSDLGWVLRRVDKAYPPCIARERRRILQHSRVCVCVVHCSQEDKNLEQEMGGMMERDRGGRERHVSYKKQETCDFDGPFELKRSASCSRYKYLPCIAHVCADQYLENLHNKKHSLCQMDCPLLLVWRGLVVLLQVIRTSPCLF